MILLIFYLIICFLNIRAVAIPRKNLLIVDSDFCFKKTSSKKCKELISIIETMQRVEYINASYKCQTSLLGLQTELIKKYYYKNKFEKFNQQIIPFVIKNC